ncbi:TonB-dependent receptor [Mesoterricola sediminis]|uniref:TonB-dependent receptor n=1 Tax=Mesoterricola sediminis TaxID=2927980 RepID=A0AA48GY38_9BACT|nr:TonB-dependent receptor [Mesoterricola sediminis]BDU76530.1 hypothetical protein METESE_14880 [Mesoterricola sediminis]
MNIRRTLPSVALLLAAATLSAQDTTGTLTGRITDKAGKAVPGARIQISSPALLGTRTATTDAAGSYRLVLLPNGAYAISADAPGYLGAKGTLHVLAGQVARFDLSLRPLKEVEKAQSATVEVVASAAQVDKTETVTQTNVAMETLNQLGNSDSSSILATLGLLTPGLSTSNLAEQGALKIRGGTGHGTKMVLNGATITEEGGGYALETGTLADMVDSMAVVQSPLNARFGNTDGGIVSIVTTKGSNTFQGSVRLNFSRPFWKANDTPYATRTGAVAAFNPATDEISRRFEYTIKGPLWKDHITFAYGGVLIPDQYYSYPFDVLQNNPSVATDPNGIFYKNQANGQIVRRSNLWAQGKYTTDTQAETYNQFVVFAQLAPDHSLEWNYTQDDQDYISTYGVINGNMSGNDAYKMRTWNLAYKGVIGTHGVLEGRFSRTTRAFPHPYSPDSPPIYLNTYPTGTADAGGAYLANSLLEGWDNGGTTVNTNGFVTDRGDTLRGESGSLNYQHLLEKAGTHIIDVGLQFETFQWNTQAQGAKYTYWAPGQIADDLTAADISGAGVKDPSAYAGKYIVFNYAALQSDLDPAYPSEPVIGSGYETLIPRVRVLSGSEAGSYKMRTESYYVNDLWTLNGRHSIMAGLRYDRLKVSDTVKTIASYGIPTVRFEYKWDIYGDQTRILNASFGQFHSRQPGSLFYPMITGRLANATTLYWNQGSATPYLVDKAALLNLSNYGYVANQSYAGQTFTVDKDWKAPVSNEWVLGLRRTYKNGGFWRASLVYRNWTNLYDFFPGEVFTSASGNPAFRSVLRNDPDAERTYKSVEIEWSIPFTRKLTFGGNYTFSRLVSNVRNLVDSPSRSSSQTNNSTNFRSWYLNYMTREEFNPSTLRDPQHVIKWFLTYDLTAGKVKSNLGLRGTYTSGTPTSRTFSYTIPYEVIPGYYDGPSGPNSNTGGLINSLAKYYGAGQFTNEDSWAINLQYNIEFPILRTLVWFTNVQVDNLFNSRTPGIYALPAQAGRDTINGAATRNPYGYQLGANLASIYGKDSLGNTIYRNGLRSVSIQTGVRF